MLTNRRTPPDYFNLSPAVKRWSQATLTEWFEHYNQVGHITYALRRPA